MSALQSLGLVLLALFASGANARAQEPELVERVEVAGNQALRSETLLFYVSTKAGERYDERRLREDFRRVWSTGLLDDLKLEITAGEKGRIVVLRVTERRRIRSLEFRGSKALDAKRIQDELARSGLALRIDALHDRATSRRAEAAILDLLARKGRPSATLKLETEDVGAAGVALRFLIDDGPRTRVEEIAFDGNSTFSDRRLRGALKSLKTAGFWNLSWLGDKSAYTPEKWRGGERDPLGERERLRQFYMNRGYVTAEIGEPKLTTGDDRTAGGMGERRIRIEIPVIEGEQYRLRYVSFQGLTVLEDYVVRALFGLTQGDVYDESKVRKGHEQLRDMYGQRGYFQATSSTRRSPDPDKRVVDLVVAVDEDKLYFVGKIRFAGNRVTRDKVVRREVFLNEGEVLDTEALRQSVRRLNQLGYFKPMERAPELTASAKAGDTLDVTFRVEEENPNRFNFGGGVSGAEGAFLNASFSTANFLGLGETIQVTAQNGTLSRNYQLAATRPYVFDRPVSAGFDVFSRRQTYKTETSQGLQGYVDERTGVSLFSGFPLAKWSRLSLGYSYEVVEISLRDAQGAAGLVSPVLLEDVGRRHESTLAPSLVRNTVDHPFTPRRGTRLLASFPITGGPLGGTLDFVKARLEAVAYLPHTARTTLGLRAELGSVFPFGATARADQATGRNGLPFYERYFLGGETQIRGYDFRSVGPRDEKGRATGGNKYLLFNVEYSAVLFGPLRLVLFYDAGQTFDDGNGFSLRQLRTSTGAELRVLLPLLNVPMRVIYALNPNRDAFQPARAFKFAVGTTF